MGGEADEGGSMCMPFVSLYDHVGRANYRNSLFGGIWTMKSFLHSFGFVI